MSQQAVEGPRQVGLFVNPAASRRIDFEGACGALFSTLLLADGAGPAAELLAQGAPGQVGLLVIDLDGFERSLDLAALGQLVAQRNGAPTLLVCPFAGALWLPALMSFGALEYAIGPLDQDQLRQAVEEQLHGAGAPAVADPADPADAAQLRALLAVHWRVQQALADAGEPGQLAARSCAALASWPGVVHAALLGPGAGGEPELVAQHPSAGLDLAQLLQWGESLPGAPLRHAFPGLLAGINGELALLDAPEKSGAPELAARLRAAGALMVVGVPAGPGAAVCLTFAQRQRFSHEHFTALGALAQLAALALRMAELEREGARLRARMERLATVDALTGAANRSHGEQLLEQELRRARRYRFPVALICLEIDDFKAVNERFGHPCGDTALRTVAEAVQSALRASDVLVRSSGAEFQIVAPHTSAVDALKMAEKVRIAIAQTAIPGCDHLTISLGVAQAGEHESGDALMVRGDAALARAKRSGRDCALLALQ